MNVGSTVRIDYLQRCGWAPRPPFPHPEPDIATRRVLHVRGTGRPWLDRPKPIDHLRQWQPPTAELVTGLYGYRIPFAFTVRGAHDGVRVRLGTWSLRASSGAEQDQRLNIIDSVLRGLYPVVETARTEVPAPVRWPHGGVAVGIPGPSALDEGDGAAPIDRIIRSLAGTDWEVVVLAYPISENAIARHRDMILNEIRAVSSASQAEGAPSPLTEQYISMLKAALSAAVEGMASGAWQTAIYLLGDDESYPRLASAWQSVMSSGSSIPEPVRIADLDAAVHMARFWALPSVAGPPPPGLFQRPFELQTLLSTAQLAAYAHLPEVETPGFGIWPAPSFSVSRPAPRGDRPVADVGEILIHGRTTGQPYGLHLDQLTRHAFVAGLTGSGKTNTIMHMLSQAAAAGIPFMVIEPAKTEYRELLTRPDIGADVRVFTVGREHISPLRINPFEVPPGVDVATHLDLLKSIFTASFAMWVPLPQVLEQCLVDLYTERGWDFGSSHHPAAGVDGVSPVPRLTDVAASVERTVPTLRYSSETTSEITASLKTRLNTLRRGARGLMLDVERSIPMDELLYRPTIIELEGLGDDADKAFMMGLLLIRLYEHRRAAHAAALADAARENRPAPPPGWLGHLVVVEEAHRLLGAKEPAGDASFHANPKGAFVDTFGQMLSEVRAYGQGIVVADQVPVRLAPDVLKNTNLKVAHRLVAGDDREAMANAMSMSPDQAAQLSVLPPGRAAVFSEGDHAPVIVQVPRAKDQGLTVAVDDAAVAAATRSRRADPEGSDWTPRMPACAGNCPDDVTCRQAGAMVESADATMLATRLWHTTIEHPDGMDAVWPDVLAFVSARVAGGDMPEGSTPVYIGNALRCFAFHAVAAITARRARQQGWAEADSLRIDGLFRAVIDERLAKPGPWLGKTSARAELVTLAHSMQARRYDPFPLCRSVCADGRCAYLHALTDVRASPRHAVGGDTPTDDALVHTATVLAEDVIEDTADAPSGAQALMFARWRAVACAAQLMCCSGDHANRQARRVRRLISDAGWDIASEED